MNAELIELGKRAVACEGWRWMPRMAAMVTFSSDKHLLPLWVNPDEMGWWNTSWKMKYSDDLVPDFSDAATKGCVIQLLRELYHDPRCALHPGDYFGSWSIWGVPCAGNSGSEGKALLAALEGAPQ